MKKKKEIEIPKNKYIYQRYNGTITKYIADNEYYIDTQTGIARQKDETAFLGKVAENIIDLIEVGDIVNKSEVYEIGQSKNGQKWIHTWRGFLYYEEDLEKATILTHEQFEQNCYTVERKEKC